MPEQTSTPAERGAARARAEGAGNGDHRSDETHGGTDETAATRARAGRTVGTRPGASRSAVPTTEEPEFSVVVPLNNEQPNVHPLVTELFTALGHERLWELVIVDDGSTDGTADEIRRAARELGPLRMLTHDQRRGQSTAIYNGIRAASAEVVVVMDGDLQNDPADIDRLLDAFSSDERSGSLGLLMGNRVERRDSGLRRFSSRIANGVRARILNDDTPDTGCGLKVVRKSVFMQLPYFDHMHRFLPALVRAAGFHVESLPVNHRPRVSGKAHYGVWDRLWVGIVDMAGVAWLARRSLPRSFHEEIL